MIRPELICLGASAGGVQAMQTLLGHLPSGFNLPIVVVQHLPSHVDINLPLIFGRFYSGEILEVSDKMSIAPKTIYFAPPDYHVLVERDHTLSLSQDERVHFSRPSIDVLFESAAWAYGPKACGIILTGANADGADGLKAIANAGGITIVQDPVEAEASAMPTAALKELKPSFVLPLEKISLQLAEYSVRGVS